MRAMLSIMGAYNQDETIFDDFRVPEGLDKDTAVKKILFDCAELGLVYVNMDIIPVLIKNWTDTHFTNWERAWNALKAEYNPIHNYDRSEEWEDNGERANQENYASGTSTDHDVAGYNESNQLVQNSRDNTGQYQEGSGSGTDKSTHEGRVYGNIGVTTSQKMVQEEVDLMMKNNIYEIISVSFKVNFCIMVY